MRASWRGQDGNGEKRFRADVAIYKTSAACHDSSHSLALFLGEKCLAHHVYHSPRSAFSPLSSRWSSEPASPRPRPVRSHASSRRPRTGSSLIPRPERTRRRPPLAPYTMTKFGPDSQPDGAFVSGVQGPTGTVRFDPALQHTGIDRDGRHGATATPGTSTRRPASGAPLSHCQRTPGPSTFTPSLTRSPHSASARPRRTAPHPA